jgi:NadR type nicotinamide-nucleotide adenylyltransferase
MAPHSRSRTRVCLTGPECIGKTTLAAQLASELGVSWVPEYAREYALTCGHVLSADDVESIARGQIENEDRVGGEVLILDTDLLSTVVYARHYYAACPDWIEQAARDRRADLYLLLDTDIAWEADAARDAGGDQREDLFDAFRTTLDEFEAQWEIVSGVGEERVSAAKKIIAARLSRNDKIGGL